MRGMELNWIELKTKNKVKLSRRLKRAIDIFNYSQDGLENKDLETVQICGVINI